MGTSPLLHQLRPLPHAAFNRLFAAVYASAVLAILYRHVTSFSTTLTHILFLISDLVLAFKWLTAQALRMYPVRREQFPENLEKLVPRDEFPALDVLICTADPYKEPPLRVVNTALSVMAYEYPAEKLSVYVSDDGGSALTLFAFLEAAKFAAYWLPFCRENDVVDRSPEVYFASSYCSSPDTMKIKIMYEEMKDKIERVMEKGTVDEEYITSDAERHAFNKWTATSAAFSTNHHPSIIQVLLHNKECKDKSGGLLPNLIYVTREKSKTTHHNFKAGALNVLASDPWFLLYIFLFLGAYGQDLYEFLTIDNKGTFLRWWNEQRMWIIRGLSCSLFGGFEFFLKSLGISQQMGFSLTSKVVDEEQSKRYDKGMFEFGVASPIFVPMTMAALISLVSFVVGIVGGCRGGWGNVDGLLIQILVSGFGVANSFPIYEAMGFRNDPGKLQMKTGLVAVCLSIVLCSVASVSIF
ncbi:Cellulose synthase-like protein G1 [Linum perenne]